MVYFDTTEENTKYKDVRANEANIDFMSTKIVTNETEKLIYHDSLKVLTKNISGRKMLSEPIDYRINSKIFNNTVDYGSNTFEEGKTDIRSDSLNLITKVKSNNNNETVKISVKVARGFSESKIDQKNSNEVVMYVPEIVGTDNKSSTKTNNKSTEHSARFERMNNQMETDDNNPEDEQTNNTVSKYFEKLQNNTSVTEFNRTAQTSSNCTDKIKIHQPIPVRQKFHLDMPNQVDPTAQTLKKEGVDFSNLNPIRAYHPPEIPSIIFSGYNNPQIPLVSKYQPPIGLSEATKSKIPTYQLPQKADLKIPEYQPLQLTHLKMPTYQPLQLTDFKIPTYQPPQIADLKIPPYQPLQLTDSKIPTYQPPQIADLKIPEYQPLKLTDSKIPTYQPPQIADLKIPAYQPLQLTDFKIPTYQPPQNLLVPKISPEFGASNSKYIPEKPQSSILKSNLEQEEEASKCTNAHNSQTTSEQKNNVLEPEIQISEKTRKRKRDDENEKSANNTTATEIGMKNFIESSIPFYNNYNHYPKMESIPYYGYDNSNFVANPPRLSPSYGYHKDPENLPYFNHQTLTNPLKPPHPYHLPTNESHTPYLELLSFWAHNPQAARR